MKGRKVLLFNLLLLIAVVLCAQQLVSQWTSFEQEQGLERILGAAEAQGAPPIEVAGAEPIIPYPEFLIVGEKNLFRPERGMAPLEPQVAEVPRPPEFPKRPQLHGISVIGGQQRAFLTTFSSPTGAGETRLVGLGENVQGYQVAEIGDTTLTLQWNDYREIIDLLDAEPKARTAAAPGRGRSAVNIIRIGSKAAAVETGNGDRGAEERGLSAVATTRAERAAAQGMTAASNVMQALQQRQEALAAESANPAAQPPQTGLVGPRRNTPRPQDTTPPDN